MIEKIGKYNTIKFMFRVLSRENSLFQRNNYLLSKKQCLILAQYHSNSYVSRSLHKVGVFNPVFNLKCSYSSEGNEGGIDRLTFENICSKTLDSLSDYFEELIESCPSLKNADVTYSDGVLTVNLGKSYGTYVINRQSPNLQIWLSSPSSGPKRYDFIGGTWVYKHDKTTLHSLLDKEIKEIANEEVSFVDKCLYAKANI